MKPHLNDMLLDHIVNSVPVLQIGRDRMAYYPGSAFAGLARNAYQQPWRAKASKEPSGSLWFTIFLDAIGIDWPVDYVIWRKGCALVVTPKHRFYWSHGKPGLAGKVLRPLYLDWMFQGALAAEYGPDCLLRLAGDPVVLDEYSEYQEQMAQLLSRFAIEVR